MSQTDDDDVVVVDQGDADRADRSATPPYSSVRVCTTARTGDLVGDSQAPTLVPRRTDDRGCGSSPSPSPALRGRVRPDRVGHHPQSCSDCPSVPVASTSFSVTTSRARRDRRSFGTGRHRANPTKLRDRLAGRRPGTRCRAPVERLQFPAPGDVWSERAARQGSTGHGGHGAGPNAVGDAAVVRSDVEATHDCGQHKTVIVPLSEQRGRERATSADVPQLDDPNGHRAPSFVHGAVAGAS